MSKRFTDTNKYKSPFFRGLQGAYKLFWDFLYHECDHAGIWIVDMDIAQIYLGKDMFVNKEDALKVFNKDKKRIVECDDGKRWFIVSFIEHQYGVLNPENRAHNSVISILQKNNVFKGLKTPLEGCKDKGKDKDKEMDKEILTPLKENFEKFRVEYPGTKKGLDEEFENFKKKHSDYKEVIEGGQLIFALNNQINFRKACKDANKEFIAEWKHLQTWINQRCWTEIHTKKELQ